MLCERTIAVEAESEEAAREVALKRLKDQMEADDLIAWEEQEDNGQSSS